MRLRASTACLALAIGIAACGSSSSSNSTTASTSTSTTGSAAASASATTTSSSASAAASTPPSAAGRCGQLLTQSTPKVTPGSIPRLSALEARTLGHGAGAFQFASNTCVATVNPAQVIRLSGIARLRPTLVVDGHEQLAGRNLEVRFIGSTVYIYLAEIGSRDGGRPWLKASLRNLSSASGLDFGQLLAEVRQFGPGHQSPLLKAAGAFAPLGRATVAGQRVAAYRASFTPAGLTHAGLPSTLAAETASKLRQLGATRETVVTYLTSTGVAAETITGLYKGSQLLTVSINRSVRQTGPVEVTAPPAAQTIAYSKVAGSR